MYMAPPGAQKARQGAVAWGHPIIAGLTQSAGGSATEGLLYKGCGGPRAVAVFIEAQIVQPGVLAGGASLGGTSAKWAAKGIETGLVCL